MKRCLRALPPPLSPQRYSLPLFLQGKALMGIWSHLQSYILLLVVSPLPWRCFADDIVTIKNTPEYQRQRACVQACLWGFPTGGDLMTNLGCTSPWYESCLCRDDLSPTASSFLTKCVNRDCSTAAYDRTGSLGLQWLLWPSATATGDNHVG